MDLKESRLNIRIEPSFKEKLQAAAKEESRTLASFVINALKQYLNQHHPSLQTNEKSPG